jgi:hypothetical protein
VHSAKVALLGGMLVVDSVMVVAIHSIYSSAAVVTASERWVSTFRATTIASQLEGTAFALAYVADSSMVA